ncbi:MAG: LysM peptidoglycan-binding domain-containing protein, partial [Verrucomicrobiales bacterium]
MKYQVYSLQQSLRATNARVDQLEKQLANWTKSGKQEPVSYAGKKNNQTRIQPPTDGGSIHHVASGDTFSSISRRYGIGLDRLIASNPGLDPHRIRIGQPITIPQSGASAPAKSSSSSSSGSKPAASGSYTVQAGDTLSAIARRHGTSSSKIIALNDLNNPNALQVGQRLQVPGASGSSKSSGAKSSGSKSSKNRFGSSAASPPPAPAPTPKSDQSSELLTAPDGYGYYEVIKGDNLYSIALSFGTTSRELRRLNKLGSDDALAIGQYLL